MNRLCLQVHNKDFLFEYISILFVMEFPIATWTVLQSNVIYNKLVAQGSRTQNRGVKEDKAYS